MWRNVWQRADGSQFLSDIVHPSRESSENWAGYMVAKSKWEGTGVRLVCRWKITMKVAP